MENQTINVCSKCKVKRQLYRTDNNPLHLLKYKTCDICRLNNKKYKKTQRLKNQRPLSSVLKDPATVTINKDFQFNNTFEDFLELLCTSGFNNIFHKVKISVPAWLIPLHSSISVPTTPSEQSKNLEEYHSKTTVRLQTHYISRIQLVLLELGSSFKLRSSNWKEDKYYVQYHCTQDTCSGKKNEGYACESKMSIIFNSNNGSLSISFNHLAHTNDIIKKYANGSITFSESKLKSLVQGQNVTENDKILLEKPSGLAFALEALHSKVTEKKC